MGKVRERFQSHGRPLSRNRPRPALLLISDIDIRMIELKLEGLGHIRYEVADIVEIKRLDDGCEVLDIRGQCHYVRNSLEDISKKVAAELKAKDA